MHVLQALNPKIHLKEGLFVLVHKWPTLALFYKRCQHAHTHTPILNEGL